MPKRDPEEAEIGKMLLEALWVLVEKHPEVFTGPVPENGRDCSFFMAGCAFAIGKLEAGGEDEE